MPYAASYTARIVAFSLRINYRLNEPPERVRAKSYDDEPKHDPPEGLGAYSIEGTRWVGDASSHPGHRRDR
jgi:hypothetical protein